MPAATATSASRHRLPGEVIRGADLFASGVYRGKTYTLADLEQIAANHRALPELDPPAVLGHEEHQEFLERTDLPAAGWVNRCWVRKYWEPRTGRFEGVLKGDIAGVAPSVAALIRARRYRKISAEIYDDFRDDFGRAHGKALRRVAFLGAEVPQVKRLGDIPLPTAFAEAAARPAAYRLRPGRSAPTGRGTFLCFAEPAPMDRPQMIQQLMAAMPGTNPATWDAMSDDQLADLVKNLPGQQAPPAAPATPPVTPMSEGGDDDDGEGEGKPAGMGREELIEAIVAAGEDPDGLDEMSDEDLRELLAELTRPAEGAGAQPVEAMGDPAAMTREELVAELTAAGQDPAQLQALTDDDLRALYAQVTGAAAPAPAAPPAAPMSDRSKAFSRLVTQATAEVKRNLEQARRHAHAARVQRVNSFCELMVRQGRILPADKPFYVRSLLRCSDDAAAVRKFSDGGKTRTGTELDAEIAALRQKPRVMKFRERLPGKDAAAPGAAGEKREVNIVTRFAERTFVGQPDLKAQYVNDFLKLRKDNPQLTAVAYGVPEHEAR